MPESTICRSCKSETKDLFSLGEHGLPPYGEGKTYPLDVVKCPSCHLVQLKDTVPQELMYNDSYGYRSGINETIKADLEGIVERATKEAHLKPGSNVLDVGSNDGQLLLNYDNGIRKYGFEPVTKLAKESQGRFRHDDTFIINDYFNRKGRNTLPMFEVITAISMFYDLDNPDEFVEDLKKQLHPHGLIIIQQNYLLRMLENTAFDNICHEHLTYFSLTSLEPLLERHGLEVFRVEENPINGGSFRTYIRHINKDDPQDVEASVADMRKQERPLTQEKVYLEFANRIKQRCEELRDSLSGKVYAYGASTRGAILVKAAGIQDQIEAVVERNPDKIGKTYLGIPIISEAEAEKNPPDLKLILPWFHTSIQEREQGPKVVPLPEVRRID